MYFVILFFPFFLCSVVELSKARRIKLDESHRVHKFFRDIDDEESWIKEKTLLTSSDDYGRELTGVQNLRKKHKRLEAEITSHEPAITVSSCPLYVQLALYILQSKYIYGSYIW